MTHRPPAHPRWWTRAFIKVSVCLWVAASTLACSEAETNSGATAEVKSELDGGSCLLDKDCPATDDPCLSARCSDAGQCLVFDRQGLPCDDGAACTVDTTCAKGQCAGGVDLCECKKNGDCANAALNRCEGAPYCNTKQMPWRCASNPASAVVCDAKKDGPCAKNSCQPVDGQCALQSAPDGSACEDGDPCTQAEQCAGGACIAKVNVCTCLKDADCADLDDGDACNGVWICDAEVFPRTCRLNTASIITCNDNKDTDCSKNICVPKDGACAMKASVDGAACEDGDPCTNGDLCKGGACETGPQNTCTCTSNADCAKEDDGDLCNGTMYCDQSLKKPTCKLNPASVVSCISVNNTACLLNVCYPKVGICQLTPIELTEPNCKAGKEPDGTCKSKLLPPGKTSGKVHSCNNGNPCTEDDVCKGGACIGGTDICACTSDAACESKFGDGDLCNGKLFCNQKTKLCALNPATVVSCPSANDTDCSKNACDPKAGTCAGTTLGKVKQVCSKPVAGGPEVCKWQVKAPGEPAGKDLPCDDANPCTTGETCDAKAKCGGGTFTCDCKVDAECASKDDGDLCNGTMFCNKAKVPSVCEHNPATVVSCKSVDDDTCVKNACTAKTGKCGLSPVENTSQVCVKGKDGEETCTWKVRPAGAPPGVMFCDDGNKCTAKGLCKGGSCATGVMTCECLKDADCEAKDDGNKCNGTLYCDKSGKQPKCLLNPASVVYCNKDPGSFCLAAACNKATSACVVVPHNEAKPCSDGSKCTSKDICQAGKCAGALVDCDDKDQCTADSCAPAKGCVYEASNCSDGNACSLDQCDPKTGKCTFATKPLDGTTCNADGSACTVNDSCSAGTCKVGSPVKCEIALKDCETATCLSLDANNFKCLKTVQADGTPCTDGASCTAGATCKSGSCEKGNTDKLYSKVWPVKGSSGQLAAVASVPDGSLVAVGGRWTGKEAAPTTSAWWAVQGKMTGAPGWSAKFTAIQGHVGHQATAVARLPDGALLVAGGSWEAGFDLNAKLARLTSAGLVQWAKHYGKAKVDESALGLAARANGSSILVGYRVVAGKRTPHVWHIAASGQFESENTLDKWRGEARAVALDAQGQAGVLMSAQGFAGKQKGRLAVLDKKGATVADVVFGDMQTHESHALVAAQGGGWLLAGSYADKSTGDEVRPWVVRLGADHQPRWQVHGKNQGVARAAWMDNGDRIRLGGTSNLSGSNANFWIQAMDGLGNVQWSRHIDGSLKDAGHGLTDTEDGGLALVGAREVAGALQGAVLRTDAWGHASCATAGVCKNKSAAACDDDKTCTVDDCLMVGGCVHSSGEGLACAPNDGCAKSGVCDKKGCVPTGEGKLFARSYIESTLVAYKGLHPLSDGVIIAGNTVGESKNYATLTRIDGGGKRLWHQKVIAHGDKYSYQKHPVSGTSVLPAAGGGYFLAGHYWNGAILTNGQPDLGLNKGRWVNQLAHTDDQGKAIWIKRIQDNSPYDSTTRALLAYPDGTLGLVGRNYGSATVNRIKSSADLFWGAELKLVGRQCEGRAAVVVAGGETVVAGTVHRWLPYNNKDNFDGPPEGLIFRLDKGGKVLWYRRPMGAGTAELRAAASDGGGGSYVGGWRKVAGKERSWLLRVAADGEILWQKLSKGDDFLRIAALARRSDGSVLVGGQATVGVLDKAWLQAVDGRGTELWQTTHVIGNVTHVEGQPMALLAKDEAVLAATSAVGGKEAGALFRVNSWGHASCKDLGKCSDQSLASCADKLPCTLDSCTAADGCTHKADTCDDGNPCTVDSCDSQAGCKTAPVSCKDGDACTMDSCDPLVGCRHPALVCPDIAHCTASQKTCKESPACDGVMMAGRCLKAHNKVLSWLEASHLCAATGRHLAVVRNAAENAEIRALVEGTCPVNSPLWLGIWQDVKTGSDWYLASGAKATWFNWAQGKAPTPTKVKAAVLQHANGYWFKLSTTIKKDGSCFVCEGFVGTCKMTPAKAGTSCTGNGGPGWTCSSGKCCDKGHCL